MRLLYVSGTYAPKAWSGGELSAHTLLKTVSQLGLAEVVVFTDRRAGVQAETQEYEGVLIQSSPHPDRVQNLLKLIDRFSPDIIFTQPYWHDIALRIAKQRKIPSVFRLPNVPSYIDLSLSSEYSPALIIVQTTKAKEYVRDKFSREAHLLPAFIDLNRVKFKQRAQQQYITMFNPVLEKGGAVFREIAREMKDRRFAFVPGWTSHRDAHGRFDKDVFQRSAESEGSSYDGQLPEEATLADLSNVTALAPRDDVGEIYAQTRILLAPSQWEEQFARVIYEACINGIPVLASSIAGILEHSSNCAMLVEDYTSPRAWMEHIRMLDDPLLYSDLAKRGKNWVEANYNLEQLAIEFMSIVTSRTSI